MVRFFRVLYGSTMSKPDFEILDLHTIALLIDYERISGSVSDPRFRHTKLREIASPDGHCATILLDPIWEEVPPYRPGQGFVLDIASPSKDHDVPENFLGPRSLDSLKTLPESRLETIFHQIRGHNGCFQIIAILQAFANLYEQDQPIHVRLADGTDFISTLSSRYIYEYILEFPRQTTVSVTLPPPGSPAGTASQSRYTGELDTMLHAVWCFPAPDQGPNVFLDIASMQFGEVGRSSSGHFFLLKKQSEWEDFADKIAEGRNEPKVSMGVSSSGDPELEEWFIKVAKR
ncbi:hypothetical protein H0H93_014695, partial [Arthromyces matolae]